MADSVLERLQNTNLDAEIWWDSSPLIFDWWVKKNVDAAPAARKKELEAQLKRLFVWEDMGKSVFRGCTTNPPLSLTAIKTDPSTWEKWVDSQIKASPGIGLKDLWWMTYKEIVKRGDDIALHTHFGGLFGLPIATTAAEAYAMCREGKQRLERFTGNKCQAHRCGCDA